MINTNRGIPFEASGYLALIVFALFCFFPVLWTTSVALSRDTSQMWQFPRAFWPNDPGLDWFFRVWAQIPIARYMANSLLIASATTLGVLLLSIPCAYALVMLPLPGKPALLGLLLVALLMPPELGLIPNFLLFSKLGMLDTWPAIVLPNLGSAFGVLLMRQAFQDLPREMLEAARVDGAGEWRILWSIALPQVKTLVATLAVFVFVQAWNDYFWPSVVMKTREKMPLSVGIFADLTGPFATSTSMVLAAVVLAMLPVLLLFALMQKQFFSASLSNQ